MVSNRFLPKGVEWHDKAELTGRPQVQLGCGGVEVEEGEDYSGSGLSQHRHEWLAVSAIGSNYSSVLCKHVRSTQTLSAICMSRSLEVIEDCVSQTFQVQFTASSSFSKPLRCRYQQWNPLFDSHSDLGRVGNLNLPAANSFTFSETPSRQA